MIISSEAQRAMEVRGPYDVINLYVVGKMGVSPFERCIQTDDTHLQRLDLFVEPSISKELFDD